MRASSSLSFSSQAPHLCAASSANNYFTHQHVQTGRNNCLRLVPEKRSRALTIHLGQHLVQTFRAAGIPRPTWTRRAWRKTKTFSMLTLQQKFKTWTSHGSNDMAQFSVREHLKIVCQTDGRGCCASGPVRNKWQIKIIKTLLMEMINEKELSCKL